MTTTRKVKALACLLLLAVQPICWADYGGRTLQVLDKCEQDYGVAGCRATVEANTAATAEARRQ